MLGRMTAITKTRATFFIVSCSKYPKSHGITKLILLGLRIAGVIRLRLHGFARGAAISARIELPGEIIEIIGFLPDLNLDRRRRGGIGFRELGFLRRKDDGRFFV